MRQIITRDNACTILKDVVKNLIVHDSCFLAAGISFYAFLSLLPLLLVGVNLLGWLFSFPFIQDQASMGLRYLAGHTIKGDTSFEYVVSLLQSFLPTNSAWVEQELQGLSKHMGTNVAISIVVGMWSGRLMFMGMEDSFSRVWGKNIQQDRTWIKRSLLGLALVAITWFLGIVLLFGAGFLNIVVQLSNHMLVNEIFGISVNTAMAWSWVVSYILTPLGVSLVFMIVYRMLPVHHIAWSYILPGALFAGIAWKLASSVYLVYGARFAEISVVYGSMWYLLGLLFWIYVMAFVFLIGAEIIQACECYEKRVWEEESDARERALRRHRKRHRKSADERVAPLSNASAPGERVAVTPNASALSEDSAVSASDAEVPVKGWRPRWLRKPRYLRWRNSASKCATSLGTAARWAKRFISSR